MTEIRALVVPSEDIPSYTVSVPVESADLTLCHLLRAEDTDQTTVGNWRAYIADGDLGLPVNEIATALWHLREPAASYDRFHGAVVIVGVTPRGALTDVPNAVVEDIKRLEASL